MTGMSCICIMLEMLVLCHTHVQNIHFAAFISARPVKPAQLGDVTLSTRDKTSFFSQPVCSGTTEPCLEHAVTFKSLLIQMQLNVYCTCPFIKMSDRVT